MNHFSDKLIHPGPDGSLLACGGIDHGLAPTWSAVASDCDGVHLTFAGLLSALFVPISTGTVSTTLWSWTYECTCWLRSAFTASPPLVDLTKRTGGITAVPPVVTPQPSHHRARTATVERYALVVCV